MGRAAAMWSIWKQAVSASHGCAGSRTALREEGPRALLRHITSLWQGGIRRWAVDLLSPGGLWHTSLGAARRLYHRLAEGLAHHCGDQNQAFDKCLVGASCPLRARCQVAAWTRLVNSFVRSGELLRADSTLARGASDGPLADGLEVRRNWSTSLESLSSDVRSPARGGGVSAVSSSPIS